MKSNIILPIWHVSIQAVVGNVEFAVREPPHKGKIVGMENSLWFFIPREI